LQRVFQQIVIVGLFPRRRLPLRVRGCERFVPELRGLIGIHQRRRAKRRLAR
jgi:hypothetical protein